MEKTRIDETVVEQILDDAINHFGIEKQKIQTTSELGELIRAITKHQLDPNLDRLVELSDEMADVEIMLKQLKKILKNKDMVARRTEYKLKRLKKYIQDDQENTFVDNGFIGEYDEKDEIIVISKRTADMVRKHNPEAKIVQITDKDEQENNND